MSDFILTAVDSCLWPHDIDLIIEKAAIVCKWMDHKIYPVNMERWFPGKETEFYQLGASLINWFAEYIGNHVE